MINPHTGESLLTLPCEFILKVTGQNDGNFTDHILQLLRGIDETLTVDKIKTNFSRSQKYIALSVNLYVTESTQIERAYQLLKNDPQVLWGL